MYILICCLYDFNIEKELHAILVTRYCLNVVLKYSFWDPHYEREYQKKSVTVTISAADTTVRVVSFFVFILYK